MVAAKKKRSGSKKMAAKRKSGGSQGHLSKAVTAIDKTSLTNQILIRGQPIPDIFRGSFTVKTAAQLSSALNTLFKIPGAAFKPIKVFPIGVPIDRFQIEVDGKIR
jgi:hypothetical protein